MLYLSTLHPNNTIQSHKIHNTNQIKSKHQKNATKSNKKQLSNTLAHPRS